VFINGKYVLRIFWFLLLKDGMIANIAPAIKYIRFSIKDAGGVVLIQRLAEGCRHFRI